MHGSQGVMRELLSSLGFHCGLKDVLRQSQRSAT